MIRVILHVIINEVASDKSGTAGDKYIHECPPEGVMNGLFRSFEIISYVDKGKNAII